jgi:tetraacyldisaccharide 4'-kinase
VALSRADMLDPAQRAEIRRRVQQLAPHADWLEITHAARGLVSIDGREEPLDSLRDKPVAAFCGLGNPAGFRHTLATCGYRVIDFREFPDHHRYTPADLKSLAAWAARLDVAAVLCTQKDMVKVGQVANLPAGSRQVCNLPHVDPPGAIRPLWAIRVGIDFLSGQETLEKRLLSLLST